MYITRSIVNRPIVILKNFKLSDEMEVFIGDSFYVAAFGEKECLCNCNGIRFKVPNWQLGLMFKHQAVSFKQKGTCSIDITHSSPSFEETTPNQTDWGCLKRIADKVFQ